MLFRRDSIGRSRVKVSIITAVHNRVSTVEQAARSVLDQTHTNIEYIVQDGGSDDGTVEVLQNLNDPRLSMVSETDDGIYDAINKGISRASGSIIGLLHSDDYLANSDVLRKVLEHFRPGVDGIYGDLDYVAESNTEWVIRRWRAGTYNRTKLRFGWMPPHPTLYLRRSVYDEWGVYNTKYQIAADYDAMLRWLGTGQISLAYVSEVLVKMRTGGESNRSLSRIVRKSMEDYKAIRENQCGGFVTLICKNLRKVPQFMEK